MSKILINYNYNVVSYHSIFSLSYSISRRIIKWVSEFFSLILCSIHNILENSNIIWHIFTSFIFYFYNQSFDLEIFSSRLEIIFRCVEIFKQNRIDDFDKPIRVWSIIQIAEINCFFLTLLSFKDLDYKKNSILIDSIDYLNCI